MYIRGVFEKFSASPRKHLTTSFWKNKVYCSAILDRYAWVYTSKCVSFWVLQNMKKFWDLSSYCFHPIRIIFTMLSLWYTLQEWFWYHINTKCRYWCKMDFPSTLRYTSIKMLISLQNLTHSRTYKHIDVFGWKKQFSAEKSRTQQGNIGRKQDIICPDAMFLLINLFPAFVWFLKALWKVEHNYDLFFAEKQSKQDIIFIWAMLYSKNNSHPLPFTTT